MKKEMILVVEDDRSILTGLQDLLEAEGYAVATAEDGDEALRVYEQGKADARPPRHHDPGKKRLRRLPGDPPKRRA